MYKEDLAFNNRQGMIWQKIKPNQATAKLSSLFQTLAAANKKLMNQSNHFLIGRSVW